MKGFIIDVLGAMIDRLQRARTERRWEKMKRLGMRIGADVVLPASTWVDAPHAYLIAIGDRCVLGEECLLLAHDAQMDEFLDAGRIGRITIHDESQLGHRTTVLPGVEIGPRTIVLPHSVVLKSLPPDTVCSGNPAKVVSSLADYVERHNAERGTLPTYTRASFSSMSGTAAGREALATSLSRGGYVNADTRVRSS